MARQTHTKRLIETSLGEHLAISVAAHLARTQLLPNPGKVYDAMHLADSVDVVANALAKVAPLYVLDTKAASPRELTPAELEGAVLRGAATRLVLKDGRTLVGVSIKRKDLRQAIAVLQAVGIAEFRSATTEDPAHPMSQPQPREWRLLQTISELERLLKPPLLPQQVQQAKALLISAARGAPPGTPVPNLAMQVMTALLAADAEQDGGRTVNVALARLRAAAEELLQTSAGRASPR